MSKYVWILDAGHGGTRPDGTYATDPKIGKQHTFPDGLNIREGDSNRAILARVLDRLSFLEVDHAVVSDPIEDVSLGERCRRANAILAKAKKPCIFVSIHSNAGAGKGAEFFTSKGQDASDVIASVFCEGWEKYFPEFPLRADKEDGDLDKEADFYVIRPDHNKVKARVLLELLFFDNRKEADFLLSTEGKQRLTDFICHCIIWIENNVTI